jgi:hypothetical protein
MEDWVADRREDGEARRSSVRPVFVEALLVTFARATPVWLVVCAMELALALAPAVAWGAWVSAVSEHRYAPNSLFADLGTVFRFDHRRAMALVEDTNARVEAGLAIAAVLLGCFVAGGWLQVFLERAHGPSLRRFFLGGARYFWRFFRVFLLTILSLALLSYLVYGAPWNTVVLSWMHHVPATDYERLESLTSEQTAFTLRFAQNALYAVLFALVLVWSDYSRTRIALHDTGSAVWAGLCTWFTLARHPVKTLGPMLWLAGIEVAIVAAAGVFARKIEGDFAARSDLVGVFLLFAIGEVALAWRVILRGARYDAAVRVSREVVRPIARPDPWKASFGPPEGPRYPLGGDEFGMSL